ncbi:anti-sigma F factor [Bacillota bacterium Meth-B3]|nr:anti-sigma F factor [Christensenellaceae bacterium]MEA5068028.1 anti-sigma F factor [Christensenellaceae bacterium]
MTIINEMRIDFLACPDNEAFARMVISAFLLPLNPTLEQLGDVKTSVSEAVTNAIVHGYRRLGGTVRMRATIAADGTVTVDVIDNGCGIADVAQARKPFFTSDAAGDRSGMGFTVMESFMDEVTVCSELGKGTTVRMTKRIGATEEPVARMA